MTKWRRIPKELKTELQKELRYPSSRLRKLYDLLVEAERLRRLVVRNPNFRGRRPIRLRLNIKVWPRDEQPELLAPFWRNQKEISKLLEEYGQYPTLNCYDLRSWESGDVLMMGPETRLVREILRIFVAGELKRVRQCAVCPNWIIQSRLLHNCCSAACRVKRCNSTEERKEYKRKYMKRHRKKEKEKQNRALRQAQEQLKRR
jgi:hypothetical protein